jgi:pyrroline-5-carboxylate reductase
MMQLVVVGGGKMGEALVGGLVAAGWAPPGAITVVEPVEARRSELERRHEGLVLVAGVDDALVAADGPVDVLVAVKPDQVADVCAALSSHAPKRVLSIAAGVTTAALASWLPSATRVVRAMPNTPALVGAGMAAVCVGTVGPDGTTSGAATHDAEDLDWASEIMVSVGEVVVVAEEKMDAVTGLSGSGPAYVFAMAEALVAAGIAAGLEPGTADALTRQTILGAARLLCESGEDPAVLRANVTSPGGTTAAGLAVLAAGGFDALVADVVAAATARSVELGAR